MTLHAPGNSFTYSSFSEKTGDYIEKYFKKNSNHLKANFLVNYDRFHDNLLYSHGYVYTSY